MRTVTSSQTPLSGLQKIAEERAVFVMELYNAIRDYAVPPELTLNMDETGLFGRARATRTLARVCAKRAVVKPTALNVPGCTVTLAVSASGDRLPAQIIFQGKTRKCLPSDAAIHAVTGCDATFAPKHWMDEERMHQWVDRILLPYCKGKREFMKSPITQPVILVMDTFATHWMADIITKMTNNHIVCVRVAENCTPWLQPLDITVNRSFKAAVRRANKICYAAAHSAGAAAQINGVPNKSIAERNGRLLVVTRTWNTLTADLP